MAEPPDHLGMWSAVASLAEQLELAMESSLLQRPLPPASSIDNIVAIGMGGSGIAGDILQAVAAPLMSVPVTVVKSYTVPAFVGDRTLAIVVSFSGDTEETLEAASQAKEKGAHLLVVTSGGALLDLASEWGCPWYLIDESIPMPRAAVGAVSIPPLIALNQMGLISGIEEEIEHTIKQLTLRRNSFTQEVDITEELAEKINGSVPLIYGGGDIGPVAALRWKNQINENVKVPAFSNAMPELCHNEIAGWSGIGGPQNSNISIIHLRHAYEHPQISRRFEFNRKAAVGVEGKIFDIKASGEGKLAQLFDLILLGDQVSLRMAAIRRQDPGPIEILIQLKEYLST
ncbi:MAG: bifunctional phosphoglucose/phosphomannose isomerase [Acidimicrobiales bacterium]|nr:bifunctional phosphoglucose/phosphomannose isomerase [Acidimicrobiales bacterium]